MKLRQTHHPVPYEIVSMITCLSRRVKWSCRFCRQVDGRSTNSQHAGKEVIKMQTTVWWHELHWCMTALS